MQAPAVVFSLLAIWALAAWAGADPTTLPSPIAVWDIIAQEATSGQLQHHMLVTQARVTAAFFLAMGLGMIIGITMGTRPVLDRWFGAWIVLFLNSPARVAIVLC